MDKKVAILLSGNNLDIESISPEKRKLHGLVESLSRENYDVALVAYSDEFVSEVEEYLGTFDIVLVWINPIENNHPRFVLDAMLQRLADEGIVVSTHPAIILKLGTKEVLFSTKNLSWGSETEKYDSAEKFQELIAQNLHKNKPLVVKQWRGNGGNGVWRIEFSKLNSQEEKNPYIIALHAQRGSIEKEMTLSDFVGSIQEYFSNEGKVIVQEFFTPIPEGMIRCYMTKNRVVGFGQQYVTTLVRETDSNIKMETNQRVYFPKTKIEYQTLRSLLETEWIPELQKILQLSLEDLPVIWDTDFLYRQAPNAGRSTYVLCEINVSSVYPFPETAVHDIVETIKKL